MRVTYKDHPDDLKCAEFLAARATEIAEAAGALKTWREPIQPQTLAVHLLGTCRTGNDRRTSVIDRNHRTYDVPNLFICDSSSMVSSSRGQPTATISALAFRAGEQIAALARRADI
jgi:choline dehydrogenase-like flavoprotein